ncbi:hypothetical protein EWY09_RS05970 [Enterococcus hirae]
MSVYESIQLMLAFATFVLLLIDKKDQKKEPSKPLLAEFLDGYHIKNKATVFLTARITDEGAVCAIPFSLSIIAYQLEKSKAVD